MVQGGDKLQSIHKTRSGGQSRITIYILKIKSKYNLYQFAKNNPYIKANFNKLEGFDFFKPTGYYQQKSNICIQILRTDYGSKDPIELELYFKNIVETFDLIFQKYNEK